MCPQTGNGLLGGGDVKRYAAQAGGLASIEHFDDRGVRNVFRNG